MDRFDYTTFDEILDAMNDGELDGIEFCEYGSDYLSDSDDTETGTVDSFSIKDHAIAKRAIQTVLTEDESDAIELRYWRNKSPEEIAEINDTSTSYVRQLLEAAEFKIRKFCIQDPLFSRSPNMSPPGLKLKAA